MFRSVFKEIQAAFDYGSMLTKIIIVNVAVYVITALLGAFFPEIYGTYILPYLAIPGDLLTLLYRPWTIITHMFLHQGFWHMAMNMLILYWFGNIAGDLLGDKKILPVYFLGGLTGAIFYVLSYQLLPDVVGIYALGASAAVLAIVFTAVFTAPDYLMHLILLGPVKIKYIGLTILFFDIIGTAGNSNTGGHIAHLGGSLFGFLFVYLLRNGTDVSAWFYKNTDKRSKQNKKSSKLKIAHRSEVLQAKKEQNDKGKATSEVDMILDKIKRNGYDSLTEEEKEILYRASKS
ncbi:MAG TPA: rhomboid family intramembrane serine protease [Saprospiraceae bacterium]|nr:rhomboid family intramembrane serine protease [Saprospiraceae bacterium]HRO08083.1 rhomboid family intramembrane serine protease [Saprospiraceae bacterium]HRO72273.1 rhomboid family intramembrane serine protease [Saprospiraceae bacterium]HRP41330.1 rhomboid family intramembrane serine protease [Saprospiraceae bacterium]